MNKKIKYIKEFIKKPLFLKVAVGFGILVMLLIAVSDLAPKKTNNAKVEPDITFISADLYAAQTEEKLREILTSIKGVGKAEVFLTLDSTEEYIYAQTVRKNGSQAEISYVIIDKGTQKEALIKKVNNPAISGVIIVCEGGGNSKIDEKIYKATSVALGIPTNRIYVTQMK